MLNETGAGLMRQAALFGGAWCYRPDEDLEKTA